ncbi:peptide deformylase [Thalassospira sp. MBR-102]|jgi:peptide deformylase|uniref:Peptide deformylase n=4 Tax=Thalassospira TaxID=168934 RepID=A0A367XCS7_9PROT|nr:MULTISPECIES: peptide deformylase [Thalassospira]UKV14746.1 peptide deformylase [Thalassospiraceae bacterium SW-3-3]KEO57300.1 peptide deformylase [Thalassospira permensis NBRC 106175]KZB52873.1 peptide deformylase [Thalassospira xiamenensis]KZB66578.1 peptide deformylase [Thalassospira lucentensis]KZD01291.1 peptide deformylase [Thalassospira xiamenensis]|tara:strand:+ start:828 stop:1346 length:519 start_codon:yes stop_codon:yes gene_type:complete
MALRDILIVPDPRLKQECEEVAEVNDEIRELLDDMLETMYAAPGIGLAAPQIGVMKRVVVMDVSDDKEKPQPLKLVNPEIIWESEDTSVYQEGCLSIPEQYADVERPAEVGLRYLDENGKEHEIEADGLLATCIQHELDHLDGILFTDYLSALKRNMILKKVQKLQKTKKSA